MDVFCRKTWILEIAVGRFGYVVIPSVHYHTNKIYVRIARKCCLQV